MSDPTFIPDSSNTVYIIFLIIGIFGYFTIRHALPEHHIRAGLAQLTAAAGKAVGFQRFPIHGGSISF